jgi:predicted nucleotidyltransferase
MKILALITEYNPFHNGHIYHIEKAKELVKPDVTVAIMSGSFTQRGEIAVTDKFARTRAALCHVDLVAELPFLNAVSSADDFARGGVHIANQLQATHLVFGSESGDINALLNAAHESRLLENSSEFNDLLKQGYSYPRAMSTLAESTLLASPNDTLGIAYINAVHESRSSITPGTIKRIGNNYSDASLSSTEFSSATSLRAALFGGDTKEAAKFMPESLISQMMSGHLASNEDFYQTLKTVILTRSPEELKSIYMMTEGLEHRLKDKIRSADSYAEFLSAVKTKRYTWTRLSRLMISILLNITNDVMAEHTLSDTVRILGMTGQGRKYLKSLDSVNIITNVNKKNRGLVSHEVTATEVYNTFTGSKKNDFNTPVIIVP